MIPMKACLLLISGVFGFLFAGSSQLQTSYDNIEFIVEHGLLHDAHVVDSVIYEGSPMAIGRFQLNDPEITMSHGMILTTGTIQGPEGPAGPNNQVNAGVNISLTPSDTTWLPWGEYMYDMAKLTVHFTAGIDSLELRYFFGSEEYHEYVGTSYRDFASIWIAGEGILPDGSNDNFRNIALFPNGTPVTINSCHSAGTNVNGQNFPAVNDSLFVDNGGVLSSTLQYDGYTKPLLAKTDLVVGAEYVLVFLIADLGDGIYDSGLFIEQCSSCNLSSNQIHELPPRIYPNPFQDLLIVERDGTEKITLELFDMSGAFKTSYDISGVREELDVSDLDAGAYLVCPIINGERKPTMSFMKY